jgi:nitroreductase
MLASMEFAEVMRKRRMIRSYEDRALPEEVVERIVRNALRAPSAGFSQGWAFLVLTDPEDRARFWTVAGAPTTGVGSGMVRAPLVVVALSHKVAYLDRYAADDKGWSDRSEAHWPAPYWDIDASFAALLMHLTAIDLGLGTCFAGITVARIPAFKEEFGIPAAYHPGRVCHRRLSRRGYRLAVAASGPAAARGRRPPRPLGRIP